jgi:peptide/nickel transport system permease protein
VAAPTRTARARDFFSEYAVPRLREAKAFLQEMLRSPLVVLGFAIIGAFVVMAVSAQWIAPFGPEERLLAEAYEPPSFRHPFGTDSTGGDVFSRVIWGAQLDLLIAFGVISISLFIGAFVGVIAGFVGGKVDEFLMRLTDVFLSFPTLILAMAIASVLGQNLLNLSIALIAVWWSRFARVARGQALVEREKLYVEAARSSGVSRWRLLWRHVLPNTIFPVLVIATLDLGAVILTAAGLSFIGFGAGPGIAEWGAMIAQARFDLLRAPWAAAFPGIAILLVSLAFNLVGDGLRDVADPRLRK